MYDPTLGRWIQQDPLGYVDGANTYQGELSNPLRFVDPSGGQASTTQPATSPTTPPVGPGPYKAVPKTAPDYKFGLININGSLINNCSLPILVHNNNGYGILMPGTRSNPDEDSVDFIFFKGKWYKHLTGLAIVDDTCPCPQQTFGRDISGKPYFVPLDPINTGPDPMHPKSQDPDNPWEPKPVNDPKEGVPMMPPMVK